jgi:DNA-binding response OmpR family regulator
MVSARASAATSGRVLVVDDDPTISDVVRRYLERAGYDVDKAADGPNALALAAERPPDLVVLDLMLPGMSGLEVCRRLRGMSDVPIVMLTALGEESDRVVGFETGADDYVTKPFSPRELALRVHSVLRRAGRGDTGENDGGPLADGDLRLDLVSRTAERHGASLALTVREFDLLAHFLRHPRRAFNRAELLQQVWGWSFGDQATVTVHVRRLREKVEDDPQRPRRIVTVWGVGYRFEPVEDPDA